MSNNLNYSKNSTLREKLAAIAINPSKHSEALAALNTAENLVNAVQSLYNALRRFANRLFPNPGLGA